MTETRSSTRSTEGSQGNQQAPGTHVRGVVLLLEDDETLAGLLANAVIAEVSSAPAGSRFRLGNILGLETNAIFLELLLQAHGSVQMPALPEAGALAVIAAGRLDLIPYLVVPPGSDGPNRGTQGFAARLRKNF